MDLATYEFITRFSDEEKYRLFSIQIKKKIAEDGGEEEKKLYEKVRYGFEVKFDFEEILKKRVKRKIFRKVINGKEVGEEMTKIKLGDSEWLDENDFLTEYLKRIETIMIWLSENTEVDKPGEILGEEK